LIFTEDQLYKECPTCQTQPLLATDALAQMIARLYPTRDPTRVTSASFSNLLAFLNGAAPANAPDLSAAFGTANWVIFAVLDNDPAFPQSGALRQLVAQRPGLLANKKVVIFAFDTPNRLEPEVIAKTTMAYALYSRTEPFIEVAVRALLGEAKPRGNPSVSVKSIDYRLITQTEPNPAQLIQLFVGDPPQDPKITPTPVTIKVGDTLKVRTGPILDRNGHIVPDGTQVTFSRTFSQTQELSPLVAPTRNGVASVSFVLDRIGPLRVRASSEPAMSSVILQLTVREQPSLPEFSTPTPGPTLLPTLTPTLTPAPTETATPTPTSTPLPQVQAPVVLPRWVRWGDLPIAVLGVLAMGSVGFWTQRTRRRKQAETDIIAHSLQWALWSVLAGLIGYVLYGAGVGSVLVRSVFGRWAALMTAVIFGAVPVLWGLQIWNIRFRNTRRK
jgi:beta-N-acetylhexosaminidase